MHGLGELVTARGASASDALPDLIALLGEYLRGGLPGVAVGLGPAAGSPWLTAVGLDDLRTSALLRPDHAMGAGSITKSFVAVLALQLVEAGRLDLDMTVGAAVGPATARGVANTDTATLAQLLSHTSGIPSWEDDPAWVRHGRGALIEPDRIWTPSAPLDYVRGQAALFAPGARYSYSNSNYTLLGLALEQVTGTPLGAELARRICDPLGLTQTCLEGFTDAAAPTVQAHRYHYRTPGFEAAAGVSPAFADVDGGRIDVSGSNLSTEWATGGLVTTVGDLLRFANALRGGALLSPRSLDFMQAWRPADQGGFVGHGLFRRPVGDRWTIGHTGSVLGSTGSFYWVEGQDTTVALLSNIGTMHIGADLPGAGLLGHDLRFVELATGVTSNPGGGR
jgi:D-alanyl-D-alanine carboxypeptidase